MSPILDELVLRLTSRNEAERFPDANAALHFLETRCEISSPRPTLSRGRLQGREALIDAIEAWCLNSREGLAFLVGPSQSGRTRTLEEAGLRVSLRDYDVRRATPPDLTSVFSTSGSVPSRAIEVAARLQHDTVVLLDDADEVTDDSFVNGLLRVAALSRGSANRLAIVVATSEVEPWLERMGLERRADPRCFDLESLSRDELTELASDALGVGDVPRRVRDSLEAFSDGLPGRAEMILRRWVDEGARSTLAGEIKLPRDDPDFADLDSLAEAPDRWLKTFTPDQRRVLVALCALDERCDIEMVAKVSETELDRCLLALRQLQGRGFTRTWPGDSTSSNLYGVPASVGVAVREHAELALDRSRAVLRFLDTDPRAQNYELTVARVRCLGEVGRQDSAWRGFARVSLAARQSGRANEALAFLEEQLHSGDARRHASRAGRAARLRALELAAQVGRAFDDPGRSDGEDFAESVAYLDRRARLEERLGCSEDAISTLSRALDSLRDADASVRRAELQSRLARLLFQNQRPDEGRRRLELSAADLRSEWNVSLAGRAATVAVTIGSCELYHGSGERAREFLERALEFAEQSKDESRQEEALNLLGVLHASANRVPDAISVFERVESMARDRGDVLAALRSLLNQGHALLRLGEVDRSVDAYRSATRLSDDLGRHALSASVWIGLAVALRERREVRSALRLYLRVLRLGTLARPADQLLARNNLGEIFASLGYLGRSETSRKQAAELARESGHRFHLGLALRGMGGLAWALGDEEAAERWLGETIDIGEQSADPRHVGGGWFFRAEIAFRRKEAQTLTLYRRALLLSERAGD
ncbi:MAG: hypothetical protein AAF517_23130, partial [Planctomycetota bacterium]